MAKFPEKNPKIKHYLNTSAFTSRKSLEIQP